MRRNSFLYERRQPEHTLLYKLNKLIEQYYPEFMAHLAEQDRTLPEYVQNEFEEYLKCGILSHGFFACMLYVLLLDQIQDRNK